MNLSYFTMPLHPLSRNYTETLKEDREAIILADKLGFAEAFVGEHITDLAETITSSMIFLATLASDTEQIKLCTGTVNLPQNHPALIAAQIAMLDHLLEGRFIDNPVFERQRICQALEITCCCIGDIPVVVVDQSVDAVEEDLRVQVARPKRSVQAVEQ